MLPSDFYSCGDVGFTFIPCIPKTRGDKINSVLFGFGSNFFRRVPPLTHSQKLRYSYSFKPPCSGGGHSEVTYDSNPIHMLKPPCSGGEKPPTTPTTTPTTKQPPPCSVGEKPARSPPLLLTPTYGGVSLWETTSHNTPPLPPMFAVLSFL